jgi:hypothetical protein
MRLDARLVVLREGRVLGDIDLIDFDLSEDLDRDDLINEIVMVTDGSRPHAVVEPWIEKRIHFHGCDERHAPAERCNGRIARLEKNLPPFG